MRNEGGCGHRYPGIGNIEYVKDLMSRTITTRNFDCSRFGAYIAPGMGWVYVPFTLASMCFSISLFHDLRTGGCLPCLGTE